jgi:signal transduction histidine kinase
MTSNASGRFHLVPAAWWAKRSIRFRLTVLYGGLFVFVGLLLLAVIYVLVANQTFDGTVGGSTSGVAPGQTPVNVSPGTQSGNKGQVTGDQLLGHAGVVVAVLVALLVVIAASVALSWVAAGRVLRPLRAMTSATRQISEENLHRRLAVEGPDDELKALGDTIDDLLSRLEIAFEAQRAFAANASHELRTPLAYVRASVDVAMSKPEPPPPQTIRLAASVRSGLDQIDRLLESFLALARAERRSPADNGILSLRDTVSSALAQRASQIGALGLRVDFIDGAEASIEGSQPLLSRMVENVIDNAIVHNEPGGWVLIQVQAEGDRARLTVTNGGPVLSQAAVDRLTEPFQRLGADRTGSDTGVGLGLSIVSAIATAHHGILTLDAVPSGGLQVTLSIPSVDRAVTPSKVA